MHVSFLTPVDLQRSKFETFLWTEIISPNPKLRWYFTVWSKSSLLYKGVTQICVTWHIKLCHRVTKIGYFDRKFAIQKQQPNMLLVTIRCQSLFSWSQIASIFNWSKFLTFWPRLVDRIFDHCYKKTVFLIWPRAESVFESSTLPK